MDQRNFTALGLSYAYFLGLLLTAEVIRRLGGSRIFGRKLALVGVGMWSIAAFALFTSWQWAIVPPLTLSVVSYVSYRCQIIKVIEDPERVNLGAVLLPLSVAILLGALWRPGSTDDAGYIAVAALVGSTWGDTAASVIGRRYGTRRFRLLGHRRTMEGMLAMFLASTATVAPVLALMGHLDWHQSLAFALIAGTVAASAELVSFYGSDNLTVPLAAAGTLYLLTRLT